MKDARIEIRVSAKEKMLFMREATKCGYKDTSEFLIKSAIRRINERKDKKIST